MSKPNYRKRTPTEWQAAIADYRRSGLSQEAYCRQHGLAYSTFTGRLAKLRKKTGDTPAGAFVEIPIPLTQGEAWDMELQIGAHVVLRLRQA